MERSKKIRIIAIIMAALMVLSAFAVVLPSLIYH
jgi:hypothetical protein